MFLAFIILPLAVLLPVVDISEKRGTHDAEGEEETHGEAEQERGGEAVREHHGVGVGAAALLGVAGILERRAVDVHVGVDGGGDGQQDGEKEAQEEAADVDRAFKGEIVTGTWKKFGCF